MSSPPSFTTIGDEPLEARIVAWVLGDASAFEVTELERLCDERPELLVFRRRMRALHGLLTEAEAARPDTAWKLPPAKRKVLDELFGTAARMPANTTTFRRPHHSRQWLSAIAACLLLLFVGSGLFFSAGTAWKGGSPRHAAKSPEFANYSVSGNREPLRTEYPPEMIEGTPKPIRLPGVLGADPQVSAGSTNPMTTPMAKSTTEELAQTAQSETGASDPFAASDTDTDGLIGGDEFADAGGMGGGGGAVAGSKSAVAAMDHLERTVSPPATAAPSGPVGGEIAMNGTGVIDATESERAVRLKLEDGRGITLNGGGAIALNDGSALEGRSKTDDFYTQARAGVNLSDGTAREVRDRETTAGDKGDRANRYFQTAATERFSGGAERNEPAPPPPSDSGRGWSSLARLEDKKAEARPADPGLPATAVTGTAVPSLGEIPALGSLSNGRSLAENAVATGDTDESDYNLGSLLTKPREPAAIGAVTLSLRAEQDVERNYGYATRSGDSRIEDLPVPTLPTGTTTGLWDEGEKDLATAEAPASLATGKAVTSAKPGDGPDVFFGRAAPDSPPPALPARPLATTSRWTVRDEQTKAQIDQSGQGVATGGLRNDLSKNLAEREMIRRQVVGKEAMPPGEPDSDSPRTEDQLKVLEVPRITTRDMSVGNIDALDQAAKADVTKELQSQESLSDARASKSPAAPAKPGSQTEAVRKGLHTADGAFQLGKYDRAKQEYENVLRTDPYNTAARRGLETIAAAKTAHYRAAYDQTRAELLMDVDGTVEMSLPPDADSLEKAALAQEHKVEESRKRLAEIVRTKGIIYHDDNSAGQAGLEDEHGARAAQDDYVALETEKTQLDGMIKTLLKYDNDELAAYAAGLMLPDNAVRPLYPKYIEAKSQLEAFKQEGRGEQHPGYQAKKQEVEALRKQLDEGTVALRDTLQAKLDLANARWERAKVAMAEKKRETIRGSVDRQDYEEAKSTLEAESAKLAALKARLASVTPKPAPPPIDPGKELAAATEPFSTFSLSISDASFKTAQAALAKGETPDPAGIRVEQFYNAMDYGDPAPRNGEAVAAAVEQAAHPLIPGRNLVRVALRTAAAGRSAAQPLQLTLLIDQSGSMARGDRKQAMRHALTQLAGLLTEHDRLTVIGFSLNARMLADGMKGTEAGKLPGLVNLAANEGGTNLESALTLAGQLANDRKLPGAQNRVVLFTDGAANLGNADPGRLSATVRNMRQNGLAFDVAGLGTSELNDRLLAELARHGNGRFYVVDAAADAPGTFAKQLAGAFRPAAENVKVQVRFNPQRVKGYKLVGFEEHRLNREDFHNDAVDAAELAAEEAGVALYQVEPLPGGSGELGELSVRFRDTATGRMIERSWPLPYEATAPAFDQASPSLQLAGLAMLGAEKLRGGPLAAAIDFSTFASSRAAVRQSYPATRRVAELMEMIDKLR